MVLYEKGDKMLRIDLSEEMVKGSKILLGFPKGDSVRKKLKLEQCEDAICITTPSEAYCVSATFWVGLLSKLNISNIRFYVTDTQIPDLLEAFRILGESRNISNIFEYYGSGDPKPITEYLTEINFEWLNLEDKEIIFDGDKVNMDYYEPFRSIKRIIRDYYDCEDDNCECGAGDTMDDLIELVSGYMTSNAYKAVEVRHMNKIMYTLWMYMEDYFSEDDLIDTIFNYVNIITKKGE